MIDEVNLETQISLVQTRLYEIFKSKNEDYGNSFAHFGILGLLVRIQDKLDRSVNLLIKKQHKIESITDTFLDIANYAVMGLCLINNENVSDKVYKLVFEQDLKTQNKILKFLGISCVLLNARYKLNQFLSYQQNKIEIININDLPKYLLNLHIVSILSAFKHFSQNL